MATWPDVEALKRRVGITRDDAEVEADAQLALDAAIETVSQDCATWLADQDPVGTPDARLASAALVLAVATYKAPDAPFGVAGVFDVSAIRVAREHPNYEPLIRGHRDDFGIG